ncbi:MAG: RNase P subunit p30 family protein [Candidatus Micrarchaeota archaeon]
MEYFDAHVCFPFKNHSEAGFSKVGVWGKDVVEFEDIVKSNRILLLESRDLSYIKPRIKRCGLIHDPEYRLDSLVMRSALRHAKPFEIPIRPLLVSSGTVRARLMGKMRRFLMFCNKRGADYVITSRARNIYETKHPAEFMAICCALGLKYDQALRAITEIPKDVLGGQ